MSGGRYVNSIANVLGEGLGFVGGVRDRHPVVSWDENGAIGRLLDAIEDARPAWHQHAACRGVGPDDFFPDGRGTSIPMQRVIRRYCDACPVKVECLDDAMAHAPNGCPGVWGGTTGRQRIAMRREEAARPLISCPECGWSTTTKAAMTKHRSDRHGVAGGSRKEKAA